MNKWLRASAIVGLTTVRVARARSRKSRNHDAFDEHDWQVERSALEFTKLRQQLAYYVAGLSAAILAYIGLLARVPENLGPLRGLIAMGALIGVATVGTSIASLVFQHESMMLNLRYSAQRRKPQSLNKREMKEWDRANRRGTRAGTASLIFLALQFMCVAVGMGAAAFLEPQAPSSQLTEEVDE